MKKGVLILLRHGKSLWNEQNRFTGWVDVPLSQKGLIEAQEAGRLLKGFSFNHVFVSSLIRAQMTAMIALAESDSSKAPRLLSSSDLHPDWNAIKDREAKQAVTDVTIAWQLNERMYGNLQGMNKDAARSEFGQEQVHIWRRSYDVPPPEGESLEMTKKRTMEYFNAHIDPRIKQGETILISAHGNSLRSIVMDLNNLSKKDVLELEIPTGVPLAFTYDGNQYTQVELKDL